MKAQAFAEGTPVLFQGFFHSNSGRGIAFGTQVPDAYETGVILLILNATAFDEVSNSLLQPVTKKFIQNVQLLKA